jgi:prophage regulatory protein
MASRILRLPEVKQRTGLSTSSIYRRIAQGLFPRSIPIGPRAVGWLASAIDEWIEQCVVAARKSV